MITRTSVVIILCLLAFPLMALGAARPENNPVLITTVDQPMDIQENAVGEYPGLSVDISINGDGFYSLMGDVEIYCQGNDVQSIHIEEPMVLGYEVSTAHNNGLWMLDLDDGEEALDRLAQVKDRLKEIGNQELSQDIDQVIAVLSSAESITQAST